MVIQSPYYKPPVKEEESKADTGGTSKAGEDRRRVYSELENILFKQLYRIDALCEAKKNFPDAFSNYNEALFAVTNMLLEIQRQKMLSKDIERIGR